MKRKINNKILKVLTTTSLLVPGLIFAEPPRTTCTVDGNAIKLCTDDVSVTQIITKITTWVLTFGGAIAVLFIVYGGIKYMTAAGNEKQVESAKQTLTYAVIGLIIVLLAQVIVVLVANSANSVLTTTTPAITS